MDFTPIMWLLSCVEMANQSNKDKPFKVVRQSMDTVEILHRDTGAVWLFMTKEVRKPIGE